MAHRPSAPISARKHPRQARSAHLVADILEAAARVLAAEGAPRFTTARVAERAGVSVGSLYQYFPNKESLLFALQSDEWTRTADVLRVLLEDRTRPPPERLRATVAAFVRSECAEARLRQALDDAAPFYRDAPEAGRRREDWRGMWRAFLAEARPDLAAAERAVLADLLGLTVSGVGKGISEYCAAPAEAARATGALADMLCLTLERGGAPTRPSALTRPSV